MSKEHNWNVYKIFNNGKRAKLATCQIVAETAVEAKKIFLEEFLSTLPKKFQQCDWVYVHEGADQERSYERDRDDHAKLQRVRDKFFAQKVAEIGGLPNKIAISLIMSAQSDWKWQWAACQPATSKYLAGISPKFNTGKEADDWLRDNLNACV